MLRAAFSSRSMHQPAGGADMGAHARDSWAPAPHSRHSRYSRHSPALVVSCGRAPRQPTDQRRGWPASALCASRMVRNARPAGITDARGEVAIPHHRADRHVFQIDRVVGAQEVQGRLVVEVGALALRPFCLLPGPAVAPPSCDACGPSCGERRAVGPWRVAVPSCGSGADARPAPPRR